MSEGTGTSILHVLDYLFGFAIFGLAYWVLNGILVDIGVIAVEGIVYDYSNMIWTGSLVIYIIIGVFWLPSKIKEFKGGVYR